MTPDARGADLLEVLEDERKALRDGRLDALTDFARLKEALIADLSRPGVVLRPDLADRLTAALDRNRALLGAAADGVARARDRVAAIRAGEDGLGTYGADGRKSAFARPRRSFETKA